MRPRERFLAALRHKPVDRVPLFDFLFQKPLYTELIRRTPASYNARDAMDLTAALGLDAVWIPFGCFAGWTPEKLADNIYKDEWGTTFEQNASSWPIDAPVAYPLQCRADLCCYRAPDPWADGRLGEIETALAMNRVLGDKAVAVCGGVAGPFTMAWMLIGYETISLSLYDDPELLHEVAAIAVKFAKAAAERMAQAGVDGMFISEDLGASAGGLLCPAHFRTVFEPALGEIVGHIKSLGLPVLFHSCGHIHDYLDDLLALGIDALHPLQRTAGMDLAAIKARYGKSLCLIGNIDSSRTLPYGTLDQIEAEVRDAIRVGAPGGGYVLASDHSLHDGIPVRNILHMYDAARRYGTC